MSLAVCLEFIKQRFSPNEGQILARSLQQDPLVWQFLQEDKRATSYLDTAPITLDAFSPGKIGVWLIEQETDESLDNINDIDQKMPLLISQKAAQAFETTFNTGLPPADLLTATLLALTLRERFRRKKNWQGVADELLIKREQITSHKNFLIWRSPLACLFQIAPDFDGVISAFFEAKSQTAISAAIPGYIHVLLANPLDNQALLEHLFSLTKSLPVDLQLESLKWLHTFGQVATSENLAKNLMQTRQIKDFFADLFSKLAMFESWSDDTDALEKHVAFDLPENVSRLAAFYYYSGDLNKASETYQKADDILEFLRAQSRFQALATISGQVAPIRWLDVINAVPHSKQARLFYLQSLLDDEQIDEAMSQLNNLPESPEKKILEHQFSLASKPKADIVLDKIDFSPKNTSNNLPSSNPSYVKSARLDCQRSLIHHLANAEVPTSDLQWVDHYLATHFHDPLIVMEAKDIFEKSNRIDRAIELTLYLTCLEPQNKSHKQVLARLYAHTEKWQKAFEIIQDLVKIDTSPDIVILENFALTAIKTNRIDMAISVCQNILQKDPHNTKSLVLLGEAYMLKGDVVKAIQHMEQVVDMIPEEGETWLALARLWEQHGQTDRAQEILSKAIVALPNNPQLLRTLGKSQLENQEPADAFTNLQKAYELEPDHIKGKLDLAKAEYLLGQNEKAWELLEPFLANYHQHPDAAKILGFVLLAMKDKINAEPVLVFAAEKDPGDLEIVLASTRLILEILESEYREEADEDRLNKIKAILKKTQSIHPDAYEIKLHLADIARLEGLHQKAMDIYTDLADLQYPNDQLSNWRLKYGLGQSAIGSENFEMGMAALQEAASMQPDNLMVLHALAEAYQGCDLESKAYEIADSILQLAPQDINNILWYARFKTKTNHPDQAIQALKEALAINPDRPELRLWLARTEIVTGQTEQARSTLLELINDIQTTSEVLQKAAYTSVQLNDLSLTLQALEHCQQQSTQKTVDAILLMDLAATYALMSQRQKALEILDLNSDLVTQFPQIALVKSDLLCDVGQYTLALETLERIDQSAEQAFDNIDEAAQRINQSPLLYSLNLSWPGYQFRLGQLNRVAGNFKEAHKALATAMASDPKQLKYQNAAIETSLTNLEHDKVQTLFNEVRHAGYFNDLDNDAILDILCSQAESLIYQDQHEKAVEVFEDWMPEGSTYPRYLAIQCKIAAWQADHTEADKLLEQSRQAYQKRFEGSQSSKPEILLRQLITQHSIAEAELALDKLAGAEQKYRLIRDELSTQPLFNWRFLYTSIRCAEAQQLADILSIKTHAPGDVYLSTEQHRLCENILDDLKRNLDYDQITCLKARISAGFNGIWPQNYNHKVCLKSVEGAAAVLISNDDHNLAQEILQSYPDYPEVLQAHGVHSLKFNKDNSEASLQRALEINPTDPVNHVILGLLNRNNPEQAIQYVETALSFWPDEPEWHAILAEHYSELGRNDQAAEHIALAIEMTPENSSYWDQSATLKLKDQEFESAKLDLEQSAAFQPKDPQIWLKMSEVNQRIGNVSEALNNIRTAAELNPDDIAIITKEIQFHIDQHNFKTAEEKADQCLKQFGEDDQTLILLSKAQSHQGKFDQALETLSSGIKNNPENTALLMAQLNVRKDIEGVEPVLPDLIALAEKNTEDPEVLTTLTDWLIQTNRLDEAQEAAQTILRIIPQQPSVHLMLGRLQRKKGQLDQAVAHLSDAIMYDPGLTDAYIELGKTHQERRDMDEAVNVFKKGAEMNTTDPRPYYFAGLALKECKDYTNAETMLKQAKKYAPDDPNIIRQLGVITALNLINNLRETR